MRDKYRFRLYNQGFNNTPMGRRFTNDIATSKGRARKQALRDRNTYVKISYDIAQTKRDQAIDRGNVRRERQRLLALRKSNRVRRFRNTASWFVQWTPTLLLGFLMTIFFGGLTNGVIEAHTERVNYYDINGNVSQSVSYDVFDYDYTFKLNQLAKMRNIFTLPDYQPTETLATYQDNLRYYYKAGYVEFNGVAGTDYTSYSYPIWSVSQDLDTSLFNEVNQFITYKYNYDNAGLGVHMNYFACNIFEVQNNDVVVKNTATYKAFFVPTDLNSFISNLGVLGRIVFVYPLSIISNLGYDLYQLYQFIFVW